jgi:3'-phosphoadenosine 5'-phosphosulfate sulfotransferase (PAPS reductase)/FAD synthetase
VSDNNIKDMQPRHVAMFSTGLSSAYMSELLIKQYGTDNVDLFMTDTLWEDEDNYRFARDVSWYLKKPITVVQDGRNPEQVFFDRKFFGNFGTAPCSTELKMRQTVIYVEDLRLQGIEPILYFGIGGGAKGNVPHALSAIIPTTV